MSSLVSCVMSPPGAAALRALPCRDATGSGTNDALLRRCFESSIGMMCETRAGDRVNGSIDGPGPTAKSGALIVKKSLTKTGFIVHDEGTLLGDGFADGTSLKDETIGTAGGEKRNGGIAAQN